MSLVSQNELNQYIKNMYDEIELPQLQAAHAGNVRKYLEDNLSNIGRYGHRDFERFGNLEHQHTAEYQQKRQDGWYSLTEEVPNIDHLTYGTGILHIHGPMEIPPYENGSGECMQQDDFYHVSKTGTQYFESTCGEYKQFMETPGDAGPMVGYQWQWMTATEAGDAGGCWNWKTIMQSVGGEDPDDADKTGVAVSVEKKMPPEFNDKDLYNVESERDHFPFVIVNSGQSKSVETLLDETLKDNNGMYDEEIPALAIGSYPPKSGGISYNGGTKPIIDFISPLEK